MKIMKKVSLLFILLVTSCTIYVERSANSSSVDSVSSSSIVSSLLSNTSISSYSSFSSIVESSSSEDVSSYVSTSDVAIDYEGVYTSKEDVSLFLYTYHELPKNFMTKSEAKQLGWDGGRIPGWTSQNKLSIGGDVFYNLEQLLPKNTTYQECDIDYNGASNRGSRRLVWSRDFKIYYTSDHYTSFVRLY